MHNSYNSKVDNMLLVTNDDRNADLNLRLINPNMSNSKVNLSI